MSHEDESIYRGYRNKNKLTSETKTEFASSLKHHWWQWERREQMEVWWHSKLRGVSNAKVILNKATSRKEERIWIWTSSTPLKNWLCIISYTKHKTETLSDSRDYLIEYCLVWFYGMSTIVGYLMPNPVFKYIKYMIRKNILRIHTVKR